MNMSTKPEHLLAKLAFMYLYQHIFKRNSLTVAEKYKDVYAGRATVTLVVITNRIGLGNLSRGLSIVSKLLSEREKLVQYFSRVILSDQRLQTKYSRLATYLNFIKEIIRH